MKITFYGVRGSIPVPEAKKTRYGGNTSCIHIEMKDGRDVVIDAGTGIRRLGQKLAVTRKPVYMLFSHSHWDHLQGFPFFIPIYQKDREIYIFNGRESLEGELCSVLGQMDGVRFPLKADMLPSRLESITTTVDASLERHGFNVKRMPLNHPGGGSAFRIEEEGFSVAYVSDNELFPPGTPKTSYDAWVGFCRGVDVLIHDAQYTEADMPLKHGWGHSLVSQVGRLGLDAGARQVVLFHHEPENDDAKLKGIEKEAKAFFKEKKSRAKVFLAREGMTIDLCSGKAKQGRQGSTACQTK